MNTRLSSFNLKSHSIRISFLTEEKRDGHEQLIHYGNTTGARIVCDICGKGFVKDIFPYLNFLLINIRSLYSIHLWFSHRFLQTSHLQKHIQAHHSDDPEKRAKKSEIKSEMCTICGLWLKSRYRLKLHRKCHSTELNRCQECGLEAPNHEALLGHIRAFHEIRRKHKCRLCEKSFNNIDELQVIIRTHELSWFSANWNLYLIEFPGTRLKSFHGKTISVRSLSRIICMASYFGCTHKKIPSCRMGRWKSHRKQHWRSIDFISVIPFCLSLN